MPLMEDEEKMNAEQLTPIALNLVKLFASRMNKGEQNLYAMWLAKERAAQMKIMRQVCVCSRCCSPSYLPFYRNNSLPRHRLHFARLKFFLNTVLCRVNVIALDTSPNPV